VERSEPIVLIGEAETGKSHLSTGLCVAARRQKRRVRFTTAAALVNELVEANQNNQVVRRLKSRWQKYELIALDEVGYVPLADIGAEFLFQVISDRAAIMVTTNLPFSEWTGRSLFYVLSISIGFANGSISVIGRPKAILG
jgi:DNA replication protein DnaC